jgi:catalase
MPLPEDSQVVDTAKEIISTLHKIFGPHPGFRPAHAKGLELTGRFSPSADAATLSAAKHFHDPSTPVTVRFSSSTGLPELPDTDPNGNPRGFALRFHLGTDDGSQRKHTDVVAHSTPFFPVRTGEEFLQFFQAINNTPVRTGRRAPNSRRAVPRITSEGVGIRTGTQAIPRQLGHHRVLWR